MDLVWEKKKLCFEVWKCWQSEAMRRDRVEAWRTLGELAEGGTMSERSVKDLEPETYYQFYTVCHFFADLNALLAEEVIHPVLAKRLFEADYLSWVPFLEKVSIAKNGSRDWYKANVRGLKTTFEAIG